MDMDEEWKFVVVLTKKKQTIKNSNIKAAYCGFFVLIY